jgi:hypothetical protein
MIEFYQALLAVLRFHHFVSEGGPDRKVIGRMHSLLCDCAAELAADNRNCWRRHAPTSGVFGIGGGEKV